jgi:hypothetical protein
VCIDQLTATVATAAVSVVRTAVTMVAPVNAARESHGRVVAPAATTPIVVTVVTTSPMG